MKYNIITTDTSQAVAVFVDGELYQATSEHPNWDKIIEAVKAGNEKVAELFEFGKTLVKGFARFSERVTFNGTHLLFDNDPVEDALAKRVVAFYEEGLDYAPLVAFFEKVAQNPEQHSREQLYRWLEAHDFAITEDGDIVAYKGVSDTSDGYLSINSGTAIVNGEVQTGRIKQNIGDVVEMPRSEVQHNPSVGCHTGLHAGTYEYARGFAHGSVLHVRINPRDVVSVPTDSDDAKMRVCRYTIIDVANGPATSALFHLASDDDFDWEDELDDDLEDSQDDVVLSSPPATPVWATSAGSTYYVDYTPRHSASTATNYRPTNDNHKSQPRDERGHFIKKV